MMLILFICLIISILILWIFLCEIGEIKKSQIQKRLLVFLKPIAGQVFPIILGSKIFLLLPKGSSLPNVLDLQKISLYICVIGCAIQFLNQSATLLLKN